MTLVGPMISGINHKIKLTNEMAAGPGNRLECRVRQGLYHELFSVEVGAHQSSSSNEGKNADGNSRHHIQWRRKDPQKKTSKGGARGKRSDGAADSDDVVAPPHLAVLFNAGVHSPELIADWAPTLELLLQAECPVLVTAFDEGEAARAELVLTRPTSMANKGSSANGHQRLDLRAQLEFGPELNKWGSLLRNSHPGQPLYTLQSLFGNSRCWFGIKGRHPTGTAALPTSPFTTQWLQSEMGRDWLSLVSG